MIRKPSKHRSLHTVFAVSLAMLLVAAACEAPLPVENDTAPSAAVSPSTDGVLVEIAEGDLKDLPVGEAVIHQLKKRAPADASFESLELAPVEEGYLLRADGVHLDESTAGEPLTLKYEYRMDRKLIYEGDGNPLHEAKELTFRLKKMEMQADESTATIDLDSPLIIIDGVIVQKADMGYLDKADIESIDIIKGAAATELYGERARNGVIQITTTKDGAY